MLDFLCRQVGPPPPEKVTDLIQYCFQESQKSLLPVLQWLNSVVSPGDVSPDALFGSGEMIWFSDFDLASRMFDLVRSHQPDLVLPMSLVLPIMKSGSKERFYWSWQRYPLSCTTLLPSSGVQPKNLYPFDQVLQVLSSVEFPWEDADALEILEFMEAHLQRNLVPGPSPSLDPPNGTLPHLVNRAFANFGTVNLSVLCSRFESISPHILGPWFRQRI